MFYSFKNLIKIFLGRHAPGRLCPIRGDDTFIVSYPKSGNTWARFIVGNLLYPDQITFDNIEKLIPDLYLQSLYYFLKMESPRIIKSHERYDKRYRKVIYIVRDPRDVVVSYWHHHLKFGWIDENQTLYEFSREFIRGRIDPYGTWFENVNGWMSAQKKNKASILIIKYEDLLSSPYTEVSKICYHLEIPNVNNKLLQQAITNSSFETMSKLESHQSSTWELTQKSRQDIRFVRKGISGIWRSELPMDIANQMVDTWGTLMAVFGYK